MIPHPAKSTTLVKGLKRRQKPVIQRIVSSEGAQPRVESQAPQSSTVPTVVVRVVVVVVVVGARVVVVALVTGTGVVVEQPPRL